MDNLLGFEIFVENERQPIRFFGKHALLNDGHVYAGLPDVKHNQNEKGIVVNYRNPK